MTFSASIVLIPPPLYSIVLYIIPHRHTRKFVLFCLRERESYKKPLSLFLEMIV